MAVLVTFSMRTDVATYEATHAMMTALGVPQPPGLIVHTAHAVNGSIAMVEVWGSFEDQHRFMSDPEWPKTWRPAASPSPTTSR